jgi:hypothetical protein
MGARRQRALERQRRQAAETPTPRTWWTSHLPVIAVGFLLALVLTIFIARQNRNAGRPEQAATDPEARTLDIDMGEFDVSPEPSAPELAADTNPPESKPAAKSPPLLSAKPKLLDESANPPAETPAETVAPPSEVQTISADSASPAHLGEPRATEETTADYPSTDPTVHRPGGRVPRTARTYPQTSTPHLR